MAANPETLDSHFERARTNSQAPTLTIIPSTKPTEKLEWRIKNTAMSEACGKDFFNYIVHGEERRLYALSDGEATFAPEATEKDVPVDIREEYSYLREWDCAIFRLPNNTLTYERVVKDLEEEHITNRNETETMYFKELQGYR